MLAGVWGLALLNYSCVASITTPNFSEGEEVLRAAPDRAMPSPAEPLKTAEPIHTLAILTGDDTRYLPNWNPRTAFHDATGREGMGVGFIMGMSLVSMLPLFVATPAVVGGLMALTTAAGGIAGATESGQGHWKPPADLMALEVALGGLRPQTEVREDFRVEAERITRRPAPMLAAPPNADPQDAPADYAALARGARADAVADLRVVAFGLAGGEMAFSVGTFAGVRARVFRASDGLLIYDKVIAQSPEAPLPDAPVPGSYTMELMAMDEGRVFRHEVGQALWAVAHAIATDPDLRLAPPPAAAPARP